VYKRPIFSSLLSKGKGLFVTLFFSFFFAFQCYGQSCQVHHYSKVDGLGNPHVYDITQDHWGRMWFATRGGISCYDGVSWENYTVSDGLPAQSFAKISVDRRGRIWALSDPFQQEKLSVVFYDGSPGAAWHQIEELEVNLPGPYDITSFQLVEQERENIPTVVVGTVQLGLFRWQGEKWKRLTTKNGLLSNSVKGIALWKGTTAPSITG
jgi:ligand-binding sensor domain-containing protein